MSRSYQYSPFVTRSRGCGKRDKKMWHGIRRMLERVQDARLPPEERFPVSKHDAINPYDLNRDGGCYEGWHTSVGTDGWYETWRDYYRAMWK